MTERKDTRDKRTRILSFIHSFIVAHEYPPSPDEISDGLAISRTTVYYHIGRMENAGMLRRFYKNGKAVQRQLEITNKGRGYINANS